MKDATTTCYNCSQYSGDLIMCGYCNLLFCSECIVQHEEECRKEKMNRITFKIPAGRSCGKYHKECPFDYDGITCRLFDTELKDKDNRTQKCDWCYAMFSDGYTVTIER